MTSRSWQLVYGELAWAGLLFGTIHAMIMGVKGWDDLDKRPRRMPPITLTSTLIPMLVMFLKLVQMASKYLLTTSHKTEGLHASNDLLLANHPIRPYHQRWRNVTPKTPTSRYDSSSIDPEMALVDSRQASFKEVVADELDL